MLYDNNPEMIEPQSLFEEYFGFKLPDSTIFIYEEQHQNEWSEDYFYAKISFEKKEYYYIKNRLLKYFKNLDYERIDDYDYLPVSFGVEGPGGNIKENEDEVKIAYMAVVSGKVVKTKIIYAIITHNKDGEYFLYVAH